jgi:AcrR family transcriptional regulator
MPSPLEKARQDPASMKAKILAAARRIFGAYGYNRTTTRMIATEVGIDISTLYYHWGEKQDLYEALLTDINDEMSMKFKEVEQQAQGRSLTRRLEIAIDLLGDYLFMHPEVSNLILFGYFNHQPQEVTIDIKVADYVVNIAVAMGLAADRQSVSASAKARILSVWNSALNFISAEDYFRPILAIDHEAYVKVVKETLKFLMVPAFTHPEVSGTTITSPH